MATGFRQLAMRAKNAVAALRGAPTGRVYSYDPHLSMRTQILRGITFGQIQSIIEGGHNGEIAEALGLFERMEREDPRLRSVAGTRRRALTGLDYEIVSAAQVSKRKIDKGLADAAADYVREKYDELDGCGVALKHLATAIGPNLAVCEVEWDPETLEPIDVFPIPSHRLAMQTHVSEDIHIITREFPRGTPCLPPKFIVHIPEATSGSPLWKSLSEAQAFIWLMKKLAIADWAAFCEIFGMPVRVGKYREGATTEEKKALEDILKNMGPSAWAMIRDSVTIEIVESSTRGIAPFEAVVNWCDRTEGVLWLGGNLTSDTTGTTHSQEAAGLQGGVRDDLRDDDIACEARTVRTQFHRPMVEFKFPGRNAPPPYFVRVKPETIDRYREAQVMKAAQGTGMSIPKEWAHKRLAIPVPTATDEVLEPVDAFVDAVREGDGETPSED